MVSKVPVIPRQELRDADGQAFAYIVSADEMSRLQAEADDLRRQLADAQRQRDYYVAELMDVLKTFIPIPPTDEEWQEAMANPSDLSGLIAELEGRS